MARKILLADDSVTAQNMGRKILADAGYEVITVNNGSAALKKIAELKPDVIVLDVYMPGYSGLEVCQRLKEVGETSRIPVLLTVGKLEPFKQEEVKRVRADGFIVKPFEASELLSALSKLEDRIVPRSEPSKPGRFARATAALDEGRYDKTVAIEEDTSWKNRIAFPSKKKETPAEAEDPAVYSPVNKDLRTVIEHKIAESPKVQDERVDLGALAPVGLPKDVTPEEIAALAAAAAQVQGKVAESKIAVPEVAVPAEVGAPKTESQPEISGPESKAETSAATFAEQKTDASVEAKETVSVPAASSASVASPAETMADEPVTMALASVTQSSAGSSRWTAVSVALAPEDAGISLEQEMQKAYAAYAAAEAGHNGSGAREADSVKTSETAPAIENQVPEPTVSVPATAAPAAVENLSEVASAATEAMSAVANELEAVADSFVTPKETAAVEPLQTSSERFGEVQAVDAVAEPSSTAEFHSAASDAKISEAVSDTSESAKEDLSKEEPKAPSAIEDFPVAKAVEVPEQEANAGISSGVSEAAPEAKADVAEEVDAKEPAPAKDSDFAASTAAAWASWHRVRESGHQDAAAKAVAAGAEDNPNDVSAEHGSESGSDPNISSIVDSVLADLRPKIVEEISRKLGKKK